MRPYRNPRRILAIDPISRGFGYVIIEFPTQRLVDWGTATCRRTAESLGQAVRRLIALCQPLLIVLEAPQSARSETRRVALTGAVAVIAAAAEGNCKFQFVPRESVLAALASLGASNKRQAVTRFAKMFPELQPKLPPSRLIWHSEDARWAIFDALTLAIASNERSSSTR